MQERRLQPLRLVRPWHRGQGRGYLARARTLAATCVSPQGHTQRPGSAERFNRERERAGLSHPNSFMSTTVVTEGLFRLAMGTSWRPPRAHRRGRPLDAMLAASTGTRSGGFRAAHAKGGVHPKRAQNVLDHGLRRVLRWRLRYRARRPAPATPRRRRAGEGTAATCPRAGLGRPSPRELPYSWSSSSTSGTSSCLHGGQPRSVSMKHATRRRPPHRPEPRRARRHERRRHKCLSKSPSTATPTRSPAEDLWQVRIACRCRGGRTRRGRSRPDEHVRRTPGGRPASAARKSRAPFVLAACAAHWPGRRRPAARRGSGLHRFRCPLRRRPQGRGRHPLESAGFRPEIRRGAKESRSRNQPVAARRRRAEEGRPSPFRGTHRAVPDVGPGLRGLRCRAPGRGPRRGEHLRCRACHRGRVWSGRAAGPGCNLPGLTASARAHAEPPRPGRLPDASASQIPCFRSAVRFVVRRLPGRPPPRPSPTAEPV